MRWLFRVFVVIALGAGGAGWFLSEPVTEPASAFDGVTGEVDRGAMVFAAAGCASCHSAPGAEGPDKLVLSGGQRFPSPFGTFLAPNISPDPAYGIGGWTLRDLANALRHGVSPEGRHYFPAFPYTAYTHMANRDIADLWTYLQTLPASSSQNRAHELSFPFNVRRGVGLWKKLYLREDWVMAGDTLGPDLTRGRYLVEALGHCAECHTPRDAFGGLDRTKWMAGAPDPSGKGKIPALTPDHMSWSAEDIAYYLETGFTPDFDSAGGHMAKVVENTGKLAREDRLAIAGYIKALSVPVVDPEPDVSGY